MTMREHVNQVKCLCGYFADQIITHAPYTIIPQECNYQSPIDGSAITTRKQRMEDMARNDCIEYDPFMKQDADRRVLDFEKQLDKSVDETVEREFETMPMKKREQLAAELTAGATIETVRL